MANSNPDAWTTPAWHSDFGNPEEEVTRLRAFAKTLLARCPQVQVNLEEPEEGYVYVDVIHDGKTVAEVYCVEDAERPRGLRYGVFIFDAQEEEQYCATETEAVRLIEPLVATANRAS